MLELLGRNWWILAIRHVRQHRHATRLLWSGFTSLVLLACNPTGASVPSVSPGTPAPASPAAPSLAATMVPAPSSAPPAASEPAPGTSADSTFHVDLASATGRPMSIDVNDESGRLTGAASGTPGDEISVPMGSVEIVNEGPSALRLTWAGPPCATELLLVVDAAATLFTVVQPECTGDSVAFDRVLVLQFDGQVSATEVTGVIQTGIDTPG